MRIRARTLAAARALEHTDASWLGSGIDAMPTNKDERWLRVDAATVEQGVDRLVRGANQVFSATPELCEAAAAIVADVDGDETDSAVRANALLHHPGRVTLEPSCWSGGLANVPGLPFVLDPRTPYDHERWEQSALLQRPPFVGRERDLEVVTAFLSTATPTAKMLVVVGPAGIGKASVVRRAFTEGGLSDHHTVVLWGASERPLHDATIDIDSAPPMPSYGPILAMLRALARAPAGHPRAAIRLQRLIDGMADVFRADQQPARGIELIAHAKVLLELLGAGREVVAQLSTRTVRVAMRRTMLLLIEALRLRAGDGRPAVLVLAGGDALDLPSRELLEFLGKRLGGVLRVLWLTTTKPRLPASLEAAFAVQRHELKPLSAPQMIALATAILDDADDQTSTLASILVDRARGSPLHLAHAMRSAVEGGLLRRTGSFGWRLDDTGTQQLADERQGPARLDRVLSGRMLRLPADARMLLCACASLGLTFMPAVINHVGAALGMSSDDIERALRLLSETGFLVRSARRPGAPVFTDDDQREDDLLLAFEHPLLRQAATSITPQDEQQAIHGAVADAYEALLSGSAIAASLARHHQLAQRSGKAVGYFGLAAMRALRLDDKVAARAWLDQAVALSDDRDIESQFSLWLERCRLMESERPSPRDEHKEALKRLLAWGQRLGSQYEGMAVLRVARFNLFAGDADRAEEASARALQCFANGSRTPNGRHLQAQALRIMSLARFVRHDLSGSLRALVQARELTPIAHVRARGVIEHQAGMIALEGDDAMAALSHLLLAREHKQHSGDLAGEGACLDAIADLYLRKGQLWTALQIINRALQLRADIGDDAGFAQSLKSRAEVMLAIGDIDDALDAATRARAQARGDGLERLEHQATLLIARIHLARGEAVQAEGVLDALRRRFDAEVHPFTSMELDLALARVKWLRALDARGSHRDRLLRHAHTRADAAFRAGAEHGHWSGLLSAEALLADIKLATGDAEAAWPHAQRAAEWLDDRSATSLPVEDILGAHARVLLARGRDEEARRSAQRACDSLADRAQDLPDHLAAFFWQLPARRALREGFAVHMPATSIVEPAVGTSASVAL